MATPPHARRRAAAAAAAAAAGGSPLLLLAALPLLTLLAALPSSSALCVTMPEWSVCASFYPPDTYVELQPQYACFNDAEASLNATGPVLWAAVGLTGTEGAYQPMAQCQSDLAQLQCMMLFPPCQHVAGQDFCHAVLGSTAEPNSGSCPLALQQSLLSVFLPNFTVDFACDSSPLFAPAPLGIGPLIPQTPSPPVPLPSCEPLSHTSVCRGVIGYPVFVPASLSFYGGQAAIEARVADMFMPAFLLADTHTGCVTSLQKALCGLVYTRCDTDVLSRALSDPFAPPVPFPRLPCRGLCEQVQEECRELLAIIPPLTQMTNCTGTGTVLPGRLSCAGTPIPSTAPDFPLNSTTFASLSVAGGKHVQLNSSCNAFEAGGGQPSRVNATEVLACPAPLAHAKQWDAFSTVAHGSCALPCPSLLLTSSEWDASDKYLTTLIICSFVSSLLLWLTWLVFPLKRKQTNTVMMNSCTLAISAVMLISVMATGGKPSKQACIDNATLATQSDGGVCLMEAASLFYFSLAGIIFWFVSAFDLYLKIVLALAVDPLMQQRLNRGYRAVGWGLPAILLIIALSLASFGGSEGTPWCFFAYNGNSSAEWLLFYYPVAIIVVVGCFCMVSTIWRVVSSTAPTARHGGWWRAQVRPAIFVGVFVFIFSFIFSYRVNIWFKESKYHESSVEFVICTLSNALTPDAGARQCGNGGGAPSDRPNLAWFFLFQLAVGGQGLLNSIIFGTQKANVDLWMGLLCKRQGVGQAGRPVAGPGHHDQSGSQGAATGGGAPGGGHVGGRSSSPIPSAARGKSGRLLSDEEQLHAHLMSGQYQSSSSVAGSYRNSRAGSYAAPAFERDEMAGSYTTLPAAIGSMMSGPSFTPIMPSGSSGRSGRSGTRTPTRHSARMPPHLAASHSGTAAPVGSSGGAARWGTIPPASLAEESPLPLTSHQPPQSS